MADVVLDTHALVWSTSEPARLSAAARAAISSAAEPGSNLYVSAISLVELVYLIEKQRIPAAVLERILVQVGSPTSGVRLAVVGLPVAEAVRLIPRERIPDMPDRIIAATALHLGIPLVTRDRQIAFAGLHVIW